MLLTGIAKTEIPEEFLEQWAVGRSAAETTLCAPHNTRQFNLNNSQHFDHSSEYG